MRAELKKDISAVLELLGERDPQWKNVKMRSKFQTLYLGWRVKELKRAIHSHLFYTKSWQRGWLPIDDWRRFRDYAME